MKKINIFFTMVILGFFLYVSAAHAETRVTLDNVDYIKGIDIWKVGRRCLDENLSYGDVCIRDNIEGKPVIGIEWGAFSGGKVQRVRIPLSVKTIGRAAFEESTIRELTIPESVQELDWCFASECEELETVYWNTGLAQAVPTASFDGCKKLKTIRFVPGAVEIGSRAFAGCISLKRIVLPNTVKNIGINAFSGCRNLEEIYIPASVENIPGNAFADARNLVIKARRYSYAHYYARANGIGFKAVGTPLNPNKNRPLIKKVQLSGNTLKTYLYDAVPGATSYTYYVVGDSMQLEDKDSFDSSAMRKVRTTKPAVTMYNLEKGNWRVYCKATLKNGKETWSNDLNFIVKQPPVEPPKVNKITVSGRNITVTVSLPKNCKGYDSVLADKWKWGSSTDIRYVVKNQTKATVTFKNVAPGTYYFSAHAFVREKINTGSKVFSNWVSSPNKIVIK